MKKGFTLAEVLITLTIIGVVAAVTIPTLYTMYQKQQYVTQLKKVYTEISQAIKLMMANEGVSKLTLSNTLYCDGYNEDCASQEVTDRISNNFFKKYFKIIKDCGTEYPSPCFASNYKNIGGADVYINNTSKCRYSIMTAGGASICLNRLGDGIGLFTIDINGLKPPNIVGRDLFYFSYYYDGSLDESVTPECRKGVPGACQSAINAYQKRETKFKSACLNKDSNYGAGCFGKILNDGWKMDY